jgi:hypothetical protein
MQSGFKGSFTLKLMLVVMLTFAMVGSMGAQTTKGTISGTVTDTAGAVVVGAKVVATDSATGDSRTVTTNASGGFRIDAVNPGTYVIEISAPTFSNLKIGNVQVVQSVVTPVAAKMKPGASETVVEVTDTGAQIQTESGELSKTIDSKSVTEIPTSSLNPYQLATTLPGVVTVSSRDDFTNGTSFSVNGLRPRANNFLIDGFDNNDNGIQGQGLQPQNAEAVQQVTVLTNAYGAEFGRGGGSVSNLSYKSGTNSWHGAAWEQYQGSRLDALTTSQALSGNTRVPQYVQNLFGFRLGGPIVKNKFFIFGTSQWTRFFGAFAGSQLTLPTANGFATLAAVAAANPGTVANQINTLINTSGGIAGIVDTVNPVASYNIGTRAGCPLSAQNAATNCLVEAGHFTRFQTAAAPAYEWTVRGDYKPTDADNIMVRYTSTHSSLAPDLFANPSSLPGFDTIQGGPAWNMGVMWTHVISPRIVNEARFTAQHIKFRFDFSPEAAANPLASGPRLGFSGITSFGGVSGTFPQGRGHDVYELQDSIAITAGKHSMKFGADITQLSIADAIPFNNRGLITYAGGGSCAAINQAVCSAFSNFIDDFKGPTPGSITKQFGNPLVNVPWTQQAYFFQDAWKLRQNLTIDLGLRYEYQPPSPSNVLPFPAIEEQPLGVPTTAPFAVRVEQRPDRNNFAPRFGFAYTPRMLPWLFGADKTVFRGGFGTFYDTFFSNINDNTAASSPNTLGGSITGGAGRGTANATAAIAAIAPTLNQLNTITTVAAGLRNPMTYQWNFGMQRELPGAMQMELAYVGTRGERLFANEQLNPRVGGGARINPAYGSIVIRGNHGDSIYHGLNANLSRSFKNGLQFRAAYTYGRAIDNVSEVFVTSGGASRRQDVFSYSGDRGPSAFNRNQRMVLSWVYQTPTLQGDGGMKILSYITRDWQFSGVASWQTGSPQTIFASFDQNGDGEGTNDRPDLGNPAVPIDYSDACLNSDTVCSGVGFFDGLTYTDFASCNVICPTGQASDFHYIFNATALGVSGGNVSRNSYLNPGFWNTDWAISRKFRAPMGRLENSAFEIKAELFNAFNHPNLGQLGGVTGDAASADFLNINSTREGGRNIRLWLKWTF